MRALILVYERFRNGTFLRKAAFPERWNALFYRLTLLLGLLLAVSLARWAFTGEAPPTWFPMAALAVVAWLLFLLIAAWQRLPSPTSLPLAELERSQRIMGGYAEHLEKTLQERTARLQAALSDLESFSYAISHDLRAPLRAMHGFATLVREDYADKLDDAAHGHLERICAAAERMNTQLRNVVVYGKLATGQFDREPIKLQSLVARVIDHHPAFQQAHARFHIREPLHSVQASPPALSLVFANLLGNAVKFTRPGQSPHITVWTEPRGAMVRIYVQDQGIGIAPEIAPRIFAPLGQGHPSMGYSGNGFGLAIVRRTVEKMGGRVGFESTVGQGSTFWVDLPAVQ